MKTYSFIKPDPTLQNNLMAFGFECGEGWYPLIFETFDKIQELLDTKYKDFAKENDIDYDFEVLQVKEKYGGLRIYVSYAPDEIWDLIAEAEEKSYTICELCGKPGYTDTYHGWVSTLCQEHWNVQKSV